MSGAIVASGIRNAMAIYLGLEKIADAIKMTYCSDAVTCTNKDCPRILIDEDIQTAKKLNL